MNSVLSDRHGALFAGSKAYIWRDLPGLATTGCCEGRVVVLTGGTRDVKPVRVDRNRFAKYNGRACILGSVEPVSRRDRSDNGRPDLLERGGAPWIRSTSYKIRTVYICVLSAIRVSKDRRSV